MPLLEAIEQRASTQGVAVDTRIIRGRTYRDALQRMLDAEPVDRVIVSATSNARKASAPTTSSGCSRRSPPRSSSCARTPRTIARSPPKASRATSEKKTSAGWSYVV